MNAVEFLIRVHPDDGGAFEASIRQFAPTGHPEVRAMVGPVSYGAGASVEAAMVCAIANARIGHVAMPRGSRYAC